MSFYSKSMFDILIERQQVLKVKVQQRTYQEDGAIFLHGSKYIYLSLGTRLLSKNCTYHYDLQVFEYKEHFGIHTLFSGNIVFDNIPGLIDETLKEYSQTKLSEDDEIRATNHAFQIVNLTDITGE